MKKVEALHILIAEDDSDDSRIIDASFRKHRAFGKIDLVQNGRELLDYLKAAPVKPDIVLTDINMPILNGIDAIKEMCDDPKLHHIPAFVYSTAINPIYEAKCMELGTKGFIVKPYTLEEFDDIPDKILAMLHNSDSESK